MLRVAAIVASLLMLVSGALGSWQRRPAAVQWMLLGGVLLVALLFERWRRPPPRDPGPWDATDERFVDPASGKVTTVSVNRRTGERRYDADV
jgi:hypothetical protein